MFDRTTNNNSYQADRALLFQIMKGMEIMALDLVKLNAALARSVAASEALIAKHTDPAVQAAVDLAADTLDAESVKAEAAAAPPVAQ